MSKNRSESIVVIPCLKISGQGITLYNHLQGYDKKEKAKAINPEDDPSLSREQKQELKKIRLAKEKQLKEEKKLDILNTVECLDRKSISGIKNSVFTLLWLSDCNTFHDDYVITSTYKKISFLTLTMPSIQRHPDTFIKSNILNQFFTEMRRDLTNFLYVWRSEKQKNGSIHFHVLMNKYYSKHALQLQWNRILEKYQYVSIFTDKFNKMTFDEYYTYMYSRYDKSLTDCKKSFDHGTKTEWKNPPSTHIQSLDSVGNIAGYISKEMTKQNQLSGTNLNNEKWAFPLSGHNWSCCEKLSAKSALSIIIPDSLKYDLSKLEKIDSKKIFKNEYITHYSISPNEFRQKKLYSLDKAFQKFLKEPAKHKKLSISCPDCGDKYDNIDYVNQTCHICGFENLL